MNNDDVIVKVTGGELLESEVNEYIHYLRNKYKGRQLEYLHITLDGDYVDLRYRFVPQDFVRIRRITGYLSQLASWNSAKQAEEKDRVKHI